ncbi:MAG TPA: EamA family transporter [Candidatus Saccharimonadia bacterium]|nr:EamA family transporter [Candidatus Saccharimonadia bacterium]
MPPLALALVLGAACLHAFWNLVIARAADTRATTALALAIGVVAALPLALLRWDVQAEAWPYIAASSVIELVYFWLLTAAYGRADLSLVYPIARGSAPVIVLLVSVAFLGAMTSVGQIAGVLLVGAGVYLVRGRSAKTRASDVALALAVAASIAAYTLVDRYGVRYADPVTYVVLILVAPAVVTILAVARNGGFRRLHASFMPITVLGGIASVAAYGLVLAALLLAPVASVAATREVSVVIATGFGALILGERVEPARWLGSVVVVVGVALLALT